MNRFNLPTYALLIILAGTLALSAVMHALYLFGVVK